MKKENVRVGVGVVVIKGDQVLLGERKNSHGSGHWAFPGGHLEHGESWEGCAVREVMEEVGIEITNIRFGTLTNDIFEKEEKHYITIFMLADYVSGNVQIMEPDKCERWEWRDWTDMQSPLFVPIENLLQQGYNPIG